MNNEIPVENLSNYQVKYGLIILDENNEWRLIKTIGGYNGLKFTFTKNFKDALSFEMNAAEVEHRRLNDFYKYERGENERVKIIRLDHGGHMGGTITFQGSGKDG